MPSSLWAILSCPIIHLWWDQNPPVIRLFFINCREFSLYLQLLKVKISSLVPPSSVLLLWFAFFDTLWNVCICYYQIIITENAIFSVMHFSISIWVIFLFTSVLMWRGGLWVPSFFSLGRVISTLGLSWQWVSSLGQCVDTITLWSNEISLLPRDYITCRQVTKASKFSWVKILVLNVTFPCK